jgi:type VI secretion system protein ImpB
MIRSELLALENTMAKKESTQHKLDRAARLGSISPTTWTSAMPSRSEAALRRRRTGRLFRQPLEPLPKLKDRKFVFIDRDNFNGVLKGIATPDLPRRQHPGQERHPAGRGS